jgi:transcriptional regulator with XRE-family HTH domain
MEIDTRPTVEWFEAGRRMRQLRERQGFTLKRVEELSEILARHFHNAEFAVPSSRLSDMEIKGVVPSIYRLHSLARIYRVRPEKILAWYGINRSEIDALDVPGSPLGRLAEFDPPEAAVVPTAVDPVFNWNGNFDVGRIVEQWGALPYAMLQRFQDKDYLYGYVGSDDDSMSPILPAGSFVQIDPTKTRIDRMGWTNDYDRPIFAVETRAGLFFNWCSVVDRRVILESHPLAKAAVKILKMEEVDILGQVVGAAIRYGGRSSLLSIVRGRP